MPRARRLLCVYYGFLALLALAGTWWQNVAYFDPKDGPISGFVAATLRFWPDTLATPASTSIAVDIGILTLVVTVVMLLEARRLSMSLPWLYVIGGLLIAISVTVPLFLIARERRLVARGEVPAELGLGHLDLAGLFALGALLIGFTIWTMG